MLEEGGLAIEGRQIAEETEPLSLGGAPLQCRRGLSRREHELPSEPDPPKEPFDTRRIVDRAYVLDWIFGARPEHDRDDDGNRALYDIALKIKRRNDDRAGAPSSHRDRRDVQWWGSVLEIANHHSTKPIPESVQRALIDALSSAHVLPENEDKAGALGKEESLSVRTARSRYLVFACQVCDYVQELWPEEELEKLKRQI